MFYSEETQTLDARTKCTATFSSHVCWDETASGHTKIPVSKLKHRLQMEDFTASVFSIYSPGFTEVWQKSHPCRVRDVLISDTHTRIVKRDHDQAD